MASKSWFLVGAAILGALYACTDKKSSAAFPGDADPRFSFSPYAAARTCAHDDDCVILPSLSNCSSCCGDGAVARGEAERAYATVVDACRGPGAPEGFSCAMACGSNRPACYEGTCIMLPDGDGFGEEPSQACTRDGGATGGGASVPDPGAGPSCGARAVQTGFEDGLDPSWTVTDPTGVRIDRDEPLAGGASLRISYQQKASYVAITQPDACAIRVAFTLRTRMLARGVTLARIVVGDGLYFHVRLDGCTLSVAEEIRTSSAAGIGGGGQTWQVPDDVPVRVVLTLDLRGNTLATAVAPLGEPLPSPQTVGVRGAPSGSGGIRAVELGAAPGIMSPGVGTVWIDDLVID